jgi:hypothetical protein
MQNNYRLDGINVNDYANGPPGSVLGGSLAVDAIEEFSVLTSNYSAECAGHNTDIFDSTGAPTGVAGLSTSTTTTAREIQFALKIIW